MHKSTLSSMEDGIAEELDVPYRLVKMRSRDDIGGNYVTMEVHVEGGEPHDSLSASRVEQLREMGWDFICFKANSEGESYALFENGPFNGDGHSKETQ